ncbi:TonB-dependent receptor domain-containing protein [Aquimarina sp. W85]|uniref:TonB-dependent receptor domain-containing protein n=1 Tax=Aquimarina rhodophyticola TaxID=3342246 RepID=UPI0036723B34
MKKIIVLVIMFFNLLVYSQTEKKIVITGQIADASTSTPLEYATVSFIEPASKRVAFGGITDKKGKFKITISPGMYEVYIEFISCETKIITQQNYSSNTNLGMIILKPSSEELDDVVITSEKTSVEIRLDKKIYNVGKDLTAAGGSLSDVLTNVPSVSVDAAGSIALRGNENVRILVDGKPSALVGLGNAEALRQLPAESIDRIEIITSPSARYDAEGTAGIINLILKKNKLAGINATLLAKTGYPETGGASGNFNYRTNKVNITNFTSYTYRETPGNSFVENRFFNIIQDVTADNGLRDDPDSYLQEDREYDRIYRGLTVNSGLEWFVNESSSITNKFLYRASNIDNITTNSITQFDENKNRVAQNVRVDPNNEKDITRQYSLNYNKKFKTSDHNLSFDFQFENSEENDATRITQSNSTLAELVSTDIDERNILLQSDYNLPLSQKFKIELGYRGIFNNRQTDFVVSEELNNTIALNNDLTNFLEFQQYVNAAYVQFGSKFGKFSILLGLRAEDTRIIIIQKTNFEFNKKEYTDVFPTSNIAYEIGKKHTITLGFNRRIRRPGAAFLNPFPARSSITNIFQGNPNLDPSYSNVAEVSYLNKMPKLTLDASIYYNHTSDVFTFVPIDTGERVTIGVDANNNPTIVPVISRTPINLNNSDRYGVDFTAIYTPIKKWRINGNFNGSYYEINGNYERENLDAAAFSWSARLNNKISLPAAIDWQTILDYRGPIVNGQIRNKGVFTTNLAFSKNFFKNKATLTLGINDVFNSNIGKSTVTASTFTSYSEYQWRVRTFNLSFTYRFKRKKSK